jgi:hypothetical protein
LGVFDQAARYAAQAEPSAVIRGLFAKLGLDPSFDGWFDTRALPLPGGPDRAADLVAMLDLATTIPTLLVIEFQSQHDPEKREVTLEEIALLRARTRHGPERQGRYRALTALVYLRGRCPNSVLDMTLPGGIGTRHTALVWNLQDAPAQTTLEAVAQGALSWGQRFWVPLMAGSQATGEIPRWREIVERTITDKRRRGDLVGIALVFSELAGCRQERERGLEEVTMTESEVLNG